jgi:hypothetical protein
MGNYCKKCLKRIPDGQELCDDCKNIKPEKGTVETVVEYTSKIIKKINEKSEKKREHCTRCGKPLSLVVYMKDKDGNPVCVECLAKEEEEKKQKQIEERYDKMKTGMSFLHISRVAQFANAFSQMKIRLYDIQNQQYLEAVLINGESIEIDVEGDKTYSIAAKVTMWKESKELIIDIGKGETVYVEIESKSVGGPLAAAFSTLSGQEMVFPKIVKREFIKDDKLTVVEAAK